ncbi:MAG: SWIM zinc finger family protein, partial [Oscillospiraceae bacterium]|nr:SWIM zinc finger family protein [Oscillospiraceae bacterium]
MNIPENLRAALAAADDAYLTGLSNKGTVNRAKKDLEKLTPTAEAAGEMAVVTMGGETVMLTAPLGKSMCSCPSTSMCRHRIGAMLWLRDQAGTAEPKKPEFETLKAYPTEKLIKQLGQKRVAGILFRHRSGTGPWIEENTIVRVELPWHPAVARLLEPIGDSTCSCHSRTFCNHRAEALLYWQLQKGIVKPEDLEPEVEETGPDPERTKGVCSAVCQVLSEQLTTGLSRMSAEVRDTVERMAAL